ncbi:MAG TPA: hypothetical protein VK171_04645, partial [Fimbriimonas sp.]|nr:hypothetical protein [Fimbriimonas sp.]
MNGSNFQRTLKAIQSQPVVDLHTHLFASNFTSHCLWGVDELLGYHYLTAEFLRARPEITPETFYSWPQIKRSDEIWSTLFVDRAPVSEATAGVATVLAALGLDPHATTLTEARTHDGDTGAAKQIDRVLALSGVSKLCMTNDPHDADETRNWLDGTFQDDRFIPVLRLDQILKKGDENGDKSPAAIRAFMEKWIGIMKPAYMAISLPPDFTYPGRSPAALFISDCVMPIAQNFGLPFAMMIGVKRAVNARLLAAGDASGRADVSSIQYLATQFPSVNFLVTTLARENAHEVAILARKFTNIKPFGCWWFLNNPSIIEEITDFRLEMLGTDMVPQHSDARILEQLLYKWRHSRHIIATSLSKRYDALERNGYT